MTGATKQENTHTHAHTHTHTHTHTHNTHSFTYSTLKKQDKAEMRERAQVNFTDGKCNGI